MAADRIEQAQRGLRLQDAIEQPQRERGEAREAAPEALAAPMAGLAGVGVMLAAPPAAAAGGVPDLHGPFLSPGSLSPDERLQLVGGVEKIMAGAFTHLPLKRARYGIDPVQRLEILRSQAGELTDEGFHIELADIVTRLRDAHTRYIGPQALEGKVAVLPFIVEMAGSVNDPSYVVTKVGQGLDPDFKPGVTIHFWNGVPIDVAIQRYSEREVGGRPDTQRAWATQSLTARALRYGPPPDEYWVVIGYRTADAVPVAKETKIDWRVIDPDALGPQGSGLFSAKNRTDLQAVQAVNPAAEAIRRSRKLLYAPRAIEGKQAEAPAPMPTRQGADAASTVVPTTLLDTFKALSIDAPGGPFGYLRIYAFNAEPEPFVNELVRLIPLLPDSGLIIDIRGNPGGYIWSAEQALQLFTPNTILPTRFSVLATPLTRDMAGHGGPIAADLAPWKASLDAAVRNGELYAQPIPITDPDDCNAKGQLYGGPVVLVADATTYSAGDLFTAGFVDNKIGPFVIVGTATGAGGANVWTYDYLKDNIDGSIDLPVLPDGIGLSFAFRRATRAGDNEGRPIEDVGIEGEPYAMTRDDLLKDRRDLIAHCLDLLRAVPFSRLDAKLDTAKRTIGVTTQGLDRVDVLLDGHPGSTHEIGAAGTVKLTYPANVHQIALIGYAGAELRQRRRFTV